MHVLIPVVVLWLMVWGVLAVTRKFWLWYWKIQDHMAVQTAVLEELKLINHQLGELVLADQRDNLKRACGL